MRKLALAMLLAGAASPTVAAQPESDDPRVLRAERAERAEARPQRRAEPQEVRAERAPRSVELSRPARPSAVERSASPRLDRQMLGMPGERAQRRVEPRAFEAPGERAQRRVAGDTVRDWRASERSLERPDSPALVEERNLRRDSPVTDTADLRVRPRDVRPTIFEQRNLRRGSLAEESAVQRIQPREIRPTIVEDSGDERPATGLVQPTRPLPRVFDPERRRRVSPTPEFGTEPPPPASALNKVAEPQHRWRHDWRHDRRHDWRDWRRRHRNLFHLGFYYDPFGWNYFRYGVGWRLWPSYYRSSFWLSDPWMYRLPRSYGPYRWVRYHNDALLVNLYTGEVEDVVYDVFW